jgi:CDP-glucose 4,6-dehydratase
MNPAFWHGRKVLLTGHTGFKGSWLSLWLQELGAEVTGYSCDVPTDPSLYETARVADGMNAVNADVRDLAALDTAVAASQAEIVIHMAAQSLVRRSYKEPVETFDTNIMGTVNVLEASRRAADVKVVIIVTSDKCYDNLERDTGYREDEAMGGYDPYSSSKGCAELVTAAYRNSFFKPDEFDSHGTAIASVRAGNVIGGGDWAEDRLIPDVFAALQRGETPVVRSPGAVRPWQFVMDPLNGYLLLAEKLWDDGAHYAGPWNFGPDDSDAREVGFVVSQLNQHWASDSAWSHDDAEHPHEATFLRLDSSKARDQLSWSPQLELSGALEWIVEWYRAYSGGGDMHDATLAQVRRFQELAVR